MSELYIGLLSGTSMDAIDAALVDFSGAKPQLLANCGLPMPITLRNHLLELTQNKQMQLNQLGQIDRQLGVLFSEAVNTLLKKNSL